MLDQQIYAGWRHVMDITLNPNILAAKESPCGATWHNEPPWVSLNRIGRDIIHPLSPKALRVVDEFKKARPMGAPPFKAEIITGQVNLFINQGGIQNRGFSEEKRDYFQWAIANIRTIYPEIPVKLTGKMSLHFAELVLKRVTLMIKS